MRFSPILVACLSLWLFPPQAQAQQAGDAKQGAGLARDWCASCHVVGTEAGGRGTDSAPSFPRIARDPAKGPDYVRGVLNGPHPPMPFMPLSQAAMNDLVAYFRELAATR